MDETAAPPTPPQCIALGPVKLTQQDGKLLATHDALRAPVEIEPAQLQRWLMRQLRELVVV